MLEDQESEPFVAEPVDNDLLVPEATLEALRSGSPMAAEGKDGGNIDDFHAKGLQAVEKLTVKDCVQLLRRCGVDGVVDAFILCRLSALSRSWVRRENHGRTEADEQRLVVLMMMLT